MAICTQNNNIGTGMKKQKRKGKFGKKNIMKRIKTVLSKCIRIGQKRMWIKAVPSGGNIQSGKGLRIPLWIRNIG
tara:strand:+ start:461 stop:685 length:225 start_codon:yes stop_codon:yes gene_type:complete